MRFEGADVAAIIGGLALAGILILSVGIQAAIFCLLVIAVAAAALSGVDR